MQTIIPANPGYFVLNDLEDGTYLFYEIIAWSIRYNECDVRPITAEFNYADKNCDWVPEILHPNGVVTLFESTTWESLDDWKNRKK